MFFWFGWMIWIGGFSAQSFGFQPFHIFAQRDLLLLVFGQRADRWTERVIGVIFAFTHDVTFRVVGTGQAP